MHRYPLLELETEIVLAMPTAVGVAIREFIVCFVIGNGMKDAFAKMLAKSYSHWLNDELVFESSQRNPIVFENTPIGPLAELVLKKEGGEYAQVLFLVDTTDSIDVTSTVGAWPVDSQLVPTLEERIGKCFSNSKATRRYERGVTLIVTCGIGRTLFLPALSRPDNDWYIETVNVDDLVHFSRNEEIDAFYLLKVLRARAKAETLTVTFDPDINFANFVAFVRHHDGNVIPHSEMPEDARKSAFRILIAPNFVADLRALSHERTDMRLATRADGAVMRVRRAVAHMSEFACLAPTYTSPIMTEAEVASVYIAPDAHWWFVLCDQPLDTVGYERYQMLLAWLRRTIPVVKSIVQEKVFESIELHFRFNSRELKFVDDISEPLPTQKDIEDEIEVEVASTRNIIRLTCGSKFELGFGHATNVSELALIRRVIVALAEWSGCSLDADEVKQLAHAITGGPNGRHMHSMVSLTYRDGFADQLNHDPTMPDQLDDGILNLGIAFKVEPRENGRTIVTGKEKALTFLNQIVKKLEDDLCDKLRRLDRAELIRGLTMNHERAVFRRDVWRRTSESNLAMHNDYPKALDAIVNRNRKYDSCIQPTRLVIEAACCECPVEGGLQPGSSDLSELMTLVNSISTNGGWSDAIYMGAMKPELKITPFGKVLADPEFEQKILQRFYTRATELSISDSAQKQARSYPATYDRGCRAEKEPKLAFRSAFLEEFGFPSEDVQLLLIELLRLGENNHAIAYEVIEAELVAHLTTTGIGTRAQAVVDEFTLRSRETWRIADFDVEIDAYHKQSNEYKSEDVHCWRLRRRLSLLRRPIIELALGRLYVVPGMIEDALNYTMNNYYYGAIRPQDLKSKGMSNWQSEIRREKGTEFANRVADALHALGWITRIERKLTEILGKKLDRNYGDVDVLAYDPDSGRVLVIECKSLQYNKSHGEIAEQMRDWRGLTNAKGKGDDLRKHLDRIEVLLAEPQRVRKFLKARGEISIEPWLIFENPVPMLHVWEEKEIKTNFASFMEVESLFLRK